MFYWKLQTKAIKYVSIGVWLDNKIVYNCSDVLLYITMIVTESVSHSILGFVFIQPSRQKRSFSVYVRARFASWRNDTTKTSYTFRTLSLARCVSRTITLQRKSSTKLTHEVFPSPNPSYLNILSQDIQFSHNLKSSKNEFRTKK